MLYRFDVKVSERDYYNLNVFISITSPSAKKKTLTVRIIYAVFIFVYALIQLRNEPFSAKTVAAAVPYILLFVVFCLVYNLILKLIISGTINSRKKMGKLLYSPESVMEFYEDYFVDDSPELKIEIKYSAIEEVYVVPDEGVYFLKSAAMNFIVPASAFGSDKEWLGFIEFIKTKCEKVTFC